MGASKRAVCAMSRALEPSMWRGHWGVVAQRVLVPVGWVLGALLLAPAAVAFVSVSLGISQDSSLGGCLFFQVCPLRILTLRWE